MVWVKSLALSSLSKEIYDLTESRLLTPRGMFIKTKDVKNTKHELMVNKLSFQKHIIEGGVYIPFS